MIKMYIFQRLKSLNEMLTSLPMIFLVSIIEIIFEILTPVSLQEVMFAYLFSFILFMQVYAVTKFSDSWGGANLRSYVICSVPWVSHVLYSITR